MTLLRARNIGVSYGKREALSAIDLPDIEAGQVVGLIGPNGSGKSTLLRAVAGELRATGEISLYAEAGTRAIDDGTRGGIVYLPQALPQPSSLLAYELLSAHAEASGRFRSRRQIEQRVDETFEELGIRDLALRPMHELSGGKRQLVGFAVALLHRPRLLLADEPTSALDLAWQIALLRAVRRYVVDGAAAIAALHDLALAARHCDLLVLLAEGRLVASGRPRDVLTERNVANVYRVDVRIEWRASGGPIIEVVS